MRVHIKTTPGPSTPKYVIRIRRRAPATFHAHRARRRPRIHSADVVIQFALPRDVVREFKRRVFGRFIAYDTGRTKIVAIGCEPTGTARERSVVWQDDFMHFAGFQFKKRIASTRSIAAAGVFAIHEPRIDSSGHVFRDLRTLPDTFQVCTGRTIPRTIRFSSP